MDLLRRVKGDDGIRHLALRGLIVAATCPDRFGLPCFRPAAAADWQAELDALLKDVAAEMQLREAQHLAPAYSPTSPRYVVADPATLCPLMMLATQIHAKELTFPWKEYQEKKRASARRDWARHPTRAHFLPFR
jgi:hypothetical protein